MARLWIETKSDIGKGTGKGASQHATAEIKWASAGDSKRAAKLHVIWEKGSDSPKVRIELGANCWLTEAVQEHN